jgi:hypothetical protein
MVEKRFERNQRKVVASTGIEPVSRAPETPILSIVLRGQGLLYQSRNITGKDLHRNSEQNYAKKFTYCE